MIKIKIISNTLKGDTSTPEIIEVKKIYFLKILLVTIRYYSYFNPEEFNK